MFTRARIKLTLLLTAIVTSLFIITSATLYLFVYNITINQMDFKLQQTASWLLRHPEARHMVLSGSRPPALPGIAPSPVLRPFLLVIFRNAAGSIVTSNNPHLATAFPRLWTSGQTAPSFVSWHPRGTAEWFRVVTIPLFSGGASPSGVIQVAQFIGPEVDILQRLAQLVWMVGLAGAAAAVIAGYMVSGRALRPIIRSWRQQQRFVGDASHELRTPLAVIQTNLDLVLSNAEESSLRNLEWVGNAKAEVRRLIRMTSDLLTLARADSQEAVLNVGCVKLGAIVGEVADTMAALAESRGVTLHFPTDLPAPDADFTVYGDANRLRQLVMILLDNALKYTRSGGVITIALDRQPHTVTLRVADTGIGMDAEVIAHAFDRFYRGDRARDRSDGGVGLGLSIAKWIADMHHGRITVQSALGAGTVFHVTLPRPTPAQAEAARRETARPRG